MDGGNMAGRWRGVGGDGGEDLLQFPVPAECQNGDFWLPRRSFAMWRLSGGFLATSTSLRAFSGRTQYVVRKGASEAGRGGHTTWPRGPPLGRAAIWCGALGPPPLLPFWLRQYSGKIGPSEEIPRIFPKVGFLHKNETPEQFC